MRSLLLAAAVALSACTHSDRIAVLSASAASLTYCDFRQTVAFSNGARWDRKSSDGYVWVEGDPLLGQRPSIARLATGLAVAESSIVWVTATDKIPTWGKYVLLGALVVGEAWEVRRMTPVVGVCGGRR